MPITKSAKKSLRQSRSQRVFNLRRLNKMKGLVKQARQIIQEGKKEELIKLLPKTYQAIDKAAKRGVIKKNTASRKKSRLSRAIDRVSSG